MVTGFEKYLVYGFILSLTMDAIPSIRVGNGEIMVPVSSLFLSLLCLLAFIRALYTQRFVSNKILLFSLFLIYFSIPLSSFFSVCFETERVVKLSMFMILPILFANMIKDYKFLIRILYCVIIIGVILGIYGFYGYITGKIGLDSQKSWWGIVAKYYGIHYLPSTRNSDIYYIAIPLFICLSLLLFGKLKSIPVKVFLAAVSLMFAMGVVLSCSRGAWISTIAAILIFGFVYGSRRKSFTLLRSKLRWLILRFSIFMIVCIIVLKYFGVTNYVIGKAISTVSPEAAKTYIKEMPSNQDRIQTMKATLKIFIDYPLGIGPGNLTYLYPYYGARSGWAENEYLNMLAEGGIIGITGYLIFIFYPLKALYNYVKIYPGDWTHAAMFLVFLYLIISYMFNVQITNLYIWVVISIAWYAIGVDNEFRKIDANKVPS